MSRLWHIFWYQHHPLQLQGWMIGNQIGGKMSSLRWPLFLLECHSYLLVLLLWARSSLVTSFVPVPTPCEFSCFFSFFSASVTLWPNCIQDIVDAGNFFTLPIDLCVYKQFQHIVHLIRGGWRSRVSLSCFHLKFRTHLLLVTFFHTSFVTSHIFGLQKLVLNTLTLFNTLYKNLF